LHMSLPAAGVNHLLAELPQRFDKMRSGSDFFKIDCDVSREATAIWRGGVEVFRWPGRVVEKEAPNRR
jgi:hypothetical protein